MDGIIAQRHAALRRGASAEQRVMEAIRIHFRRYGGAPSFTEIHDMAAVRRSDIRRVLVSLERKGMVMLRPGIARGIMLVDRGAMLSDTELELAAIGRGGRIEWSAPAARPLAEAFNVPAIPDCELPLDRLLGQIDVADGEYPYGSTIGEAET